MLRLSKQYENNDGHPYEEVIDFSELSREM